MTNSRIGFVFLAAMLLALSATLAGLYVSPREPASTEAARCAPVGVVHDCRKDRTTPTVTATPTDPPTITPTPTDTPTPSDTPTPCSGTCSPTATPTPLFQLGADASETSAGVVQVDFFIRDTGGGCFTCIGAELKERRRCS